MYDIIEKIFAVILAVILMFFFPLLDSFERMDDLAYMTVYASTVKFVDAVKNTGRITPSMYYDFIQTLDATGNIYEVEMVHRKVQYFPQIDNSATGTYGYIELYDEMYTYQILAKMGIITVDADTEEVMYTGTDMAMMADYEDFTIGDYFYVSVQNTSITPATILKKVLYGAEMSTVTIVVPYGGMIRNVPIKL